MTSTSTVGTASKGTRININDGSPDAPPLYDIHDDVFTLHRGGKMAMAPTVPVDNPEDLSRAYTPGVARVCNAIAESPHLSDEFTWVNNTVAVVTDGTAVLGLGDIGPAASMPVMEGKAVLFKTFGGVDAIPIALDTKDVDAFVETVVNLAPSFGGINLEDISAPRCFEIEQRLIDRLAIPVFHDDQHGTSIVTLAALYNAARLTGRRLPELRVVISGAGAAGVAVERLLRAAGVNKICVLDSRGIIDPTRRDLTPIKRRLAERTANWARPGSMGDALVDADVFIGVSGGHVPEEQIARMADNAIIFALANPVPEVDPEVAVRHARVVATGRSDYPNQINNVLVFPGLFRGALDARAKSISQRMKLAAAAALADLVKDDLREDYIIASPFDSRVPTAISNAVVETVDSDGRGK